MFLSGKREDSQILVEQFNEMALTLHILWGLKYQIIKYISIGAVVYDNANGHQWLFCLIICMIKELEKNKSFIMEKTHLKKLYSNSKFSFVLILGDFCILYPLLRNSLWICQICWILEIENKLRYSISSREQELSRLKPLNYLIQLSLASQT